MNDAQSYKKEKKVSKCLMRLSVFLGFILLCSISLKAEDSCKSYSLTNAKGVPLDHLLRDIMPYNGGFFIEAGANDGIRQSNTKLFEEKYGWQGILIEPSKNIFPELCINRPHSRCFNCALGSFQQDGEIAFGDFDGHLMASLLGRLDRPKDQGVLIRSLQSILDICDITHVNFFSLDTEGYELNILKGIDFAKTTFDYILIEIYANQYDGIVSLLDSNGYELVCNLSGYNKIDNPNWDGSHNDYLFKNKTLP